MKATFDGTTILDIEYSAKEIKPHFCRATREMEFDCYLDGRYIGTANSHGEAAAKLDALVFDALTHGDTATAEELDGGSYCATCGNEGDCPDCSPRCATCGGEGDCPDCEPKAEPIRIRIQRGAEIVQQSAGKAAEAPNAFMVLATRDRDSGCMLFAMPSRGLCYVAEGWVAS